MEKMGNNKRSVKILRNNPLGEYYIGLDERGKRRFMLVATSRLSNSPVTIYRWLRGMRSPRPAEAIVLGEITGIAPAELYPQLFILDNIK